MRAAPELSRSDSALFPRTEQSTDFTPKTGRWTLLETEKEATNETRHLDFVLASLVPARPTHPIAVDNQCVYLSSLGG